MNRFIIDEKLLKYFEGMFFLDDEMLKELKKVRSHPYQSERDCPVCGGGLMRHFWCIDRDCGWDSIKEVRELRQAGSP